MRKIPTTDIQDGMILARPLLGPGGTVLLGEGTALRAALIPRLVSWGIPILHVQGEGDEPGEPPIDAGSLRSSLETLFGSRLAQPAMRDLFEAVIAYRSQPHG